MFGLFLPALRRAAAPAVSALRVPACAAVLATFCASTQARTEVCGTFSLATEWTSKDSPYIVTGDIFVPGNSRLRIGPGVIVRFAKPRPCASDKPKEESSGAHDKGAHAAAKEAAHEEETGKTETAPAADPAAPEPDDWADSVYTGIKAEGTFYALGTEDQPILFEPDDAKPGTVGWDGLRFSGQQAHAAEIAFCVFRGANQAIQAEKAGFFVHHCLFEANNTGVACNLRGDLSVINCDFIGNLSAGMVITKGGPRIANNIFAENKSYGIWGDGRPAIQTWNNDFWANREEACYKCPYAILQPAKLNANKDSVDRFGNMQADPVFMDSPSYKAAQDSDLNVDTPAHLVKDEKLAKLESDARAKQKKKAKDFRILGKGPYLLSQYSKLTDAGIPGSDFRDRDGSPNDIGLHGGPMGRITRDPF